MRTISNEDYARAIRLLRSFSRTDAITLREFEERRQARRLLRKWERAEKRRREQQKDADDKFHSQDLQSEERAPLVANSEENSNG